MGSSCRGGDVTTHENNVTTKRVGRLGLPSIVVDGNCAEEKCVHPLGQGNYPKKKQGIVNGAKHLIAFPFSSK